MPHLPYVIAGYSIFEYRLNSQYWRQLWYLKGIDPLCFISAHNPFRNMEWPTKYLCIYDDKAYLDITCSNPLIKV